MQELEELIEKRIEKRMQNILDSALGAINEQQEGINYWKNLAQSQRVFLRVAFAIIAAYSYYKNRMNKMKERHKNCGGEIWRCGPNSDGFWCSQKDCWRRVPRQEVEVITLENV